MVKIEQMVSLLFMSANGRTHDDVVDDALNNPQDITKRDYYLVAQMPARELFGKTPSEVANELGAMTIGPEWKSTGRRSMLLGDIVCIGKNAYLSIAECDVPPTLKAEFTALDNAYTKKDDKTYPVGVVNLKENKTWVDIIQVTSLTGV